MWGQWIGITDVGNFPYTWGVFILYNLRLLRLSIEKLPRTSFIPAVLESVRLLCILDQNSWGAVYRSFQLFRGPFACKLKNQASFVRAHHLTWCYKSWLLYHISKSRCPAPACGDPFLPQIPCLSTPWPYPTPPNKKDIVKVTQLYTNMYIYIYYNIYTSHFILLHGAYC